MDEQRMLTAKAAANRVGVTPHCIYRWIREGRLPAFRAGNAALRLRESDVNALLVPVVAGGRRNTG